MAKMFNFKPKIRPSFLQSVKALDFEGIRESVRLAFTPKLVSYNPSEGMVVEYKILDGKIYIIKEIKKSL